MASRTSSLSGVMSLLMAIGSLAASKAVAQTKPQSPSDLIRYLTYQSDRPDKHGTRKGEFVPFSCGGGRPERPRLGRPIIPCSRSYAISLG